MWPSHSALVGFGGTLAALFTAFLAQILPISDFLNAGDLDVLQHPMPGWFLAMVAASGAAIIFSSISVFFGLVLLMYSDTIQSRGLATAFEVRTWILVLLACTASSGFATLLSLVIVGVRFIAT